MLKLILISLTFALSLATMAIDMDIYSAAKLSASDLQCLIGKGAQYFNIELRNDAGYINTNFTTSYKYLKTAGIKHIDAILSVCDAFTPDKMCSDVAKNLPEGFDGKVWLNLFSAEKCFMRVNTDTDDSCWKSTYSQFLHYLEGLVATCEKYNLTVGILGTANNYNWHVSGDMRRSSPILVKYPVWYVHIDKKADFNDFPELNAGFGGWKQPFMKRYGGLQKICNTYASTDFTDLLPGMNEETKKVDFLRRVSAI